MCWFPPLNSQKPVGGGDVEFTLEVACLGSPVWRDTSPITSLIQNFKSPCSVLFFSATLEIFGQAARSRHELCVSSGKHRGRSDLNELFIRFVDSVLENEVPGYLKTVPDLLLTRVRVVRNGLQSNIDLPTGSRSSLTVRRHVISSATWF